MNRFVELIPRQRAKYGEREALRFRNHATDTWESISWIDFAATIDRAAGALLASGVEPQGRVCIFTHNCPEVLVAHFAAFYNRAIPVPIYATSSKDEAAYIVNDAGATILFAGNQEQYNIARQAMRQCPSLKFIVTLHPAVVRDDDDKTTLTWSEFLATGDKLGLDMTSEIEARKQAGTDDDTMYLIYTSGTTGMPKGVMLTHSNFNAAMDAHTERIKCIDDSTDVSLSFLPFSHVFELGWTMVCLITGIRVAINYDPKEIQRAVKEVQPNYMCSVPRFWEKVYTAVNDNLQHAKPVVRMMVKQALRIGKARNLSHARLGKKAPALVEKQYQYFETKVYSKLRNAIGIPEGKFFPTAGAMLSDNITEFMHALGINIVIGYGLSETNASVSFFHPDGNWTIGTVGTPISSIEVKIGEQNEILVKGPTVMKGYYNKPEETARAIDADGWLHTGDCGEIAPTGEIILTERLKDLYKTSNGKYIAPQVLETMLGQDKFIEQVAVIGDGRKYVSALIVPDYDLLKAYAAKKGINAHSVEALVNDPDIHKMIEARINDYQKGLASYEQIKRFVLLPRAFSMEAGELTNTLKIKRAVINKRYAPLIDAMYAADFRKKKDSNN